MNIDYCPARCAACDGKGIPEALRPYCSIVCRILGRAGLGWQADPYRIIDLRLGDQVSVGFTFDLTTKGISDLQKQANRKQEEVSNFGLIAERMSGGVEVNA